MWKRVKMQFFMSFSATRIYWSTEKKRELKISQDLRVIYLSLIYAYK